MSFSNPLYLWALAGLIIPVAVHLWSKKEGKTIKIGSVQLLDESDSKKSRSVQLNELALLLLRLFLIGLLVLIMAGLQISSPAKTTPITYLIEPSLLKDDRMISIIDTINEGDIKLLQPDFPFLEELDLDNIEPIQPRYWQLASEMNYLQTDSIIVFTQAFSKGLKGIRPKVRSTINWILLDIEMPSEEKLFARKINDSIQLLSVTNTSTNLSYNVKSFDLNRPALQFNDTKDSLLFKDKSIPIIKQAEINVLLYYDNDFSKERYYLESSLKAISKYLDTTIEISVISESTKIENKKYDLIIWLSKEELKHKALKYLIYKQDDLASHLISKSTAVDIFYLAGRLNSSNAVDLNLAEELLKVIAPYELIQKNNKVYDNTTVALNELIPTEIDLKTKNKPQIVNINTTKWLWLLLVLSLITERIISKLKTQ